MYTTFRGHYRLIGAALSLTVLAGCAMIGTGPANSGITSVRSPHSVKVTIDRLEAAAKARGFAIPARVDHSAGAQRVGATLRPTELLIFGNPQGGTPLMNCAQSAGIDLPLKGLAWQDASGQVWVGYNSPAYLGARHGISESCAAPLGNMTKALESMMQEVIKP